MIFSLVSVNDVCCGKTKQIYNNTLHNWLLLGEMCQLRLQPILFVVKTNVTLDSVRQLEETARRLGWTVLDAPRVSPFGVPCVRDMYALVAQTYDNCTFHGFVNGDILFDGGLARTLYAVFKVSR